MLWLLVAVSSIIAGAASGNVLFVILGCAFGVIEVLLANPKKEAEQEEEAEEITYKHTLLPQEQPPDQTRMPMSATTPGLSVNFGNVVESAEPDSEKHRKRVLGTK